MSLLFDKFILLISCTLLFLHCLPQVSCLHVLAFLCSIIFLCLCSCCNLEALPLRQLPSHTRPALILLWLLLGMASLLHPAFGFLLPFLSYELSVASGGYFHLFVGLLPFLSFRRDSPFTCQSSASLPHPAPPRKPDFLCIYGVAPVPAGLGPGLADQGTDAAQAGIPPVAGHFHRIQSALAAEKPGFAREAEP